MINAPQAVIDALESGNFSYANLIKINLGDAYGQGSDVILYRTDCGHSISHDGNLYEPDKYMTEIAGISRKASTGSDSVEIRFNATDPQLIQAIKSERYINKPTSIDRVILQDGAIVGDFTIPVRTAWGISHNIEGDTEERLITLVIDSSLGDLKGDNGWYAVNASHEQRYAGDKIMQHSGTVMTEEQQKKYTTNFSGTINQRIKPPALPKIYGYKNVELVPVMMLKHRKTHSSYRHYFTTFIYVIGIGDLDHVDTRNLRENNEKWDASRVSDTNYEHGGWSYRVRTPAENNISCETDPKLNFWRQRLDTNETARLRNMYGKGLTLLFVINRNRDDWIQSPPRLTVPVRGSKVFDPRDGQTRFSRNPALQYADFLRSTEYGLGNRGIPVTDDNISALANHFDQIPDSVGNAGINDIKIDIQMDTGQPIVDNMNIWMEGCRLYTSDYYGQFNVRVETKSAKIWDINEKELLDVPEYDSGDFTDRLNQLTYTVKQLVQDTSEDAISGDLVEVDVEATFPPDGSPIHANWLAEDGGMHHFDSEQLDYVTVLEQGYYWAMVDSRISRQPRTMTIKTNHRGWLIEVGDVIGFTSEPMDMTDVLWRVDEVSEDETVPELKLVAYDDNFYTPDPSAIPDPVAPAKPPTGAVVSPPSGLSIVVIDGAFYLTWNLLSSANVSHYAVEIKDSEGDIVVDKPIVAVPPVILEGLTIGDYTATVTTIGHKVDSNPALLAFTVAPPVIPNISITPDTFQLEINPSVTGEFLGVLFELKISQVNDINVAFDKGLASNFTIVGLKPNTTYYVWVRTVTIAGKSDWASANAMTLDGSLITELVSDLVVDTSVIEAELETIPRAWETLVQQVSDVFGEGFLGQETLVNTQEITKESAVRNQQMTQANNEISTLNNVTLPAVQSDLSQLNGKFPVQSTNIADDSITTPKLVANSVIAEKIIAGAIVADKIAANAVSADKIVANAITAAKIATNAIVARHLSADSVTADSIAAGAIIADLIAANAIIAEKIAAGAITADKIAAEAITADKIAANSIESDMLAANIILGVNAVFKGKIEGATGWFSAGLRAATFTAYENPQDNTSGDGRVASLSRFGVSISDDTNNTTVRSDYVTTPRMNANDIYLIGTNNYNLRDKIIELENRIAALGG